jgi:hypothetical protein
MNFTLNFDKSVANYGKDLLPIGGDLCQLICETCVITFLPIKITHYTLRVEITLCV